MYTKPKAQRVAGYVSLRLREDEKAKLVAQAVRECRTVSQIIRFAILAYLGEPIKPLKRT